MFAISNVFFVRGGKRDLFRSFFLFPEIPLPFFSLGRPGDIIDSPVTERIATQKAPQRKERGTEKAVRFVRAERIFGTARIIFAGRRFLFVGKLFAVKSDAGKSRTAKRGFFHDFFFAFAPFAFAPAFFAFGFAFISKKSSLETMLFSEREMSLDLTYGANAALRAAMTKNQPSLM